MSSSSQQRSKGPDSGGQDEKIKGADPNSPEAVTGRQNAKKAIIGLASAVMVATVAAVASFYASEADAWVGTVNGRKLLREDYNRDLELRKKQYQSRMGVNFSSPQGVMMLANLQKDVLDQLVERELLLEEADKRKVGIADPEVETRLRGLKTQFPDEASFKKALQENGITPETLREQVRIGLIVEKLRDEMTKDASVSLADAQKYYDANRPRFEQAEEVKASHILLKTEAEAKDVHAKIKGGGDFAQLAREKSEDSGSKPQGGDLGYFGKGRMVKEFEDAAFGLGVGEVSRPVKSQFGYHVIKVVDRKKARTRPFEEVKGELVAQQEREKKETSFRDWIKKQHDAATIVIRPKYQASSPTPPPAAAATGSLPIAPMSADEGTSKAATH
ncbi:MAG: peptidylprolyl isomerase [Candidatus Sericytochromatia bacterium]|uniref:peptidylprolyl isomerase n=1 Tax=Candidatus Tanganyikabacteria bacterium TaxID=2961651 RepID=A0A938BML0_9BACT|nr:peptidylprolyl isomerase [Candidatus Tanganyikabacteria bacterium]